MHYKFGNFRRWTSVWIFIFLLSVVLMSGGCTSLPQKENLSPVPWTSLSTLDLPTEGNMLFSASADGLGNLFFLLKEESNRQVSVKTSSMSAKNEPGLQYVIGTFHEATVAPLFQTINERGDIAIIAFVRTGNGQQVVIWHKSADYEWTDVDNYTYAYMPAENRINLIKADLDQNGNLLVAWSDGSDIETGYCEIGGVCRRSGSVETGFDRVSDLDLAFESQGKARLVWTQTDGYKKSQVMTSVFKIAASPHWLIPEEIGRSSIPNFLKSPRLAISDSGAMVAWIGNEGETINARFYHPSRGWSDMYAVYTDGRRIEALDIGSDERGNTIALWSDYSKLPQRENRVETILSRRFDAKTGQWEPLVRVDSDTRYESESSVMPVMAMNPDGEALVVWHEPSGEVEAMGRQFHPEFGWGLVTGVASSQSECLTKERMWPIAADRDFFLVWSELSYPGIFIMKQ